MKKYLFGLFAIVLAIGFSAFTTLNNRVAEGDVYANITGEDYILVQDFNEALCEDASDITCAYEVTEEGAPFVTSGFDDAQAQEWLSLGYIRALSEFDGIYVFD